MEITKSLKEDIVKIQNELITAIQNHQVLVLRQQVGPSDNIKLQIEEVQRHIICLGESQKILVNRLQNELESQKQRANNKKPNSQPEPVLKGNTEHSRLNNGNHQETNRSLLIKNVAKEQSLVKSSHASDRDSVSERLALIRTERQRLVDSSSEDNRTPCLSPSPDLPPLNGTTDVEERGVKRSAQEGNWSPNKRAKHTLQSAPRPSSPVPSIRMIDSALTSSSEESLDSLPSKIVQQKETFSQADFALVLGLVTKEAFNKILVKKSERRKRRTISQSHHLYNESWDLTVQGSKRGRVKDYCEDSTPPLSPSVNPCYMCNKPVAGESIDCRICQASCHAVCATDDICTSCARRENQIAEKRKQLDELRLSNREMHKSVSKLRERAKVLSASLVRQTEAVNQLVEQEEHLTKSINRIKDFVTTFQAGPSTLQKDKKKENAASETT